MPQTRRQSQRVPTMTSRLDPFTYILVDHKPVQHANNGEWFMWFEALEKNRLVAKTQIGDVWVSTVFCGIDRSYGRAPQPVLFETMIFGGEHDQEQWPTVTWEEAEAKHDEVVVMLTPEK
jgi:hypothetical protein